MKLLLRTMRDKYGVRNHIVFTDESGVSKPLGVFDDIALSEFIEMYYREQLETDKALIRSKQ